MKRFFVVGVLFMLSVCLAFAQEQDRIYFAHDTVSAVASDTLGTIDSLKIVYDDYGDILRNLDGCLVISESLGQAMEYQLEKNKGRRVMGYRVRIYFDNSQNARFVSQEVADTFKVHYPDIPVYRIYDTPYFKVTVGEFYTKSDAMRFIMRIRKKYPSAFLVREPFSTI